MRLWSIHPSYLDSKGLVAVWREGLLALSVLKGNTVGYKNHPQLNRFRSAKSPVSTLKWYLWQIYQEALARGYGFDVQKLGRVVKCRALKVTQDQLIYELNHLRKKLKKRDPSKLRSLSHVRLPKAHPLFRTVIGNIEEWEKIAPEDPG